MRSCTILIAGFLTFIAISACTRKVERTRNVVVALSQPPSTLDPLFTTDATGSRIAGLLYSSFVRIGSDLKPEPEAATWKQTGTSFVFTILPHLTFSDGSPLEPEDVDASFAAFRTSAFASSFKVVQSFASKRIGNHIETTVVLAQPSATFLSDLMTLKILKRGSHLGTGPFVLESESANDIVVRARKDHPYWAPKIEGVDFKIVRDDNTRVMKMQKGELDLAQAEFPAMKIAQLEKSQHLTIYKYPGLALTYLLINLKDPYLNNLKNREAMAGAIDRESIVRYKLDGLASEATSLLTPINPYFDKTLAPIKRARLDHSPSPELVLKTSSAPAAVENGKLIAADLKKAGFNVRVQSFEWGTFYGDVQSGRFQLATLRWVGTIDPDLYRKALHSKETPPGGRNRGSYANSDVDRLTEEGLREADPVKRKMIYDEVQKQVLKDLPFIPLWYDTEVAVVNKRIKNYVPPPDGSFWILTKVEKTE
jgi:peptide/nickel transport system substrate-binding protein